MSKRKQADREDLGDDSDFFSISDRDERSPVSTTRARPHRPTQFVQGGVLHTITYDDESEPEEEEEEYEEEYEDDDDEEEQERRRKRQKKTRAQPRPTPKKPSKPPKGSLGQGPTRPAQTVRYPERSDEWPRLPAAALHQNIPARTVGEGMNAGRNLMAFYGNDNVARTRYPLRIIDGRTGREWNTPNPSYPDSTTIIPRGTSLEEIVRQYPYHAWGRCLRLFMAEGLTADRVYEMLPRDARNNSATTRQWNYLQKAFERQARAMRVEQDAMDHAEAEKSPTPAAQPAAVPRAAPTPVTNARSRPVTASGTAESNDPQLRPHAQPAAPPSLPSLPSPPSLLEQIQATLRREQFNLIVDVTMMLREMLPGFTELTSEEQRHGAEQRIAGLMLRYQRRLEQELPARLNYMISVQESGMARVMQLLIAIIDLTSTELALPTVQQQVARTRYRAYERLLIEIQRLRQNVANQRARLRERSNQQS